MPFARKNSMPKGRIPLEEVSGVILAGGKSSRYGINKAFVKVEGIALIDRVAGVLQSVFEETVIVTNNLEDYAYLDMPMRHDIVPGLGPLGGIFTGLQMITGEAGFFVACDMPFLNPRLIRYLSGIKNGTSRFDVVIPRIAWKLEALHALYGRRCVPHIEKLIHSGNYQIIKLFPNVSVRHVEAEEIVRFDPELKSFFNINRPQELLNIEHSREYSLEKEPRRWNEKCDPESDIP